MAETREVMVMGGAEKMHYASAHPTMGQHFTACGTHRKGMMMRGRWVAAVEGDAMIDCRRCCELPPEKRRYRDAR
jgi:hypothetical protein